MAGYRRPVKIFKLIFEEPEYAGLEVRTKGVALGVFLSLTDLAALQGAKTLDAGQIEQISHLFEIFSDSLLSWNLEGDNGEPVPATLEGIRSQDFDFVLHLIASWMEAIAGVAAPLVKSLNGGEPIQEASLPMAPISGSLQYSTTPN